MKATKVSIGGEDKNMWHQFYYKLIKYCRNTVVCKENINMKWHVST